MTIGEYPTWSLTVARKQTGTYRQQIDQGIDILEERRAERAEPTVADVVDRYCTARADKLKSGTEIRGTLERYLVPALGNKKIRTVRRRDAIEVIEDLAVEHGRTAAAKWRLIPIAPNN